MAGDGFDVDTDQLKSAAPRFHREADALAKATQKLKGSLDGLGSRGGMTNRARSSSTSTPRTASK